MFDKFFARRVLKTFDLFDDDDDTSLEMLLTMVSDECECDVSDVVEILSNREQYE